ncbi:MAG: hypothetical protein K2P57_01250 [Burkholderiales bacterium]|nr:hypothetical protein [Burkholderiales bacterium]
MAWVYDNPLGTLTDVQQNKVAQDLWELEKLGGLTEDNNKLPVPVVWLLVLTILTAFAITFPLWGQRPTAAIYEEQVKLMDTPEIQAIKDDKAAMKAIEDKVIPTSKYSALIVRHPVTMDDLRIIKPQIEALEKAGKDLEEYNVIGNQVALANFEGNRKEDGSKTRKQPWWDKGYTIDVFYLTAFCVSVMVVVKRLPPSTWQPKH